MSTNRRTLLTVLLVVTLSGFIFASVAGAAKPKVTLTFMYWGDIYLAPLFDSYIKAFNSEYPDIKVEMIHSPSYNDYQTKLLTMIAAGTPPDVMMMDQTYFLFHQKRGTLLDLTPYMDRDKSLDLNEVFPEAMNTFRVNKRYYGFPKDFTTRVMYVNKSLFRKAGLSLPSVDWEKTWTWGEFLRAAQALTKDTNGDKKPDQWGFLAANHSTHWLNFVWQNKGELFDDDLFPTKSLVTSKATSEAFQFYADLIGKYKVSPTPDVISDLGETDMFMNGNIGMLTNFRARVPAFVKIKDFEWDVVPLPRNKQPGNVMAIVAYSVSARTKHPEEAYTLARFLGTSIKSQELHASLGNAIPAIKSVAYSKAFINPTQPPDNDEVFLTGVKYSRPRPTTEHWPKLESIIQPQVEKMLFGMESVSSVLQAMNKQLNDYLDSVTK